MYNIMYDIFYDDGHALSDLDLFPLKLLSKYT